MKTQILSANLPEALILAGKILQTGGLVAFPTDTIYGLGALSFNGKAIKAIYRAKKRPFEKAIPVLLSEAEELDKVSSEVPEIALRLADHFWPGPLTLVIPKRRTLPNALSSTDTIGVRVPDDVTARALLRTAGPLAVTSANISGGLNPSTAQEVFDQLNGRIELILDGGRTPGGIASTVVDCTKTEPIILRSGPISIEEINTALA